MKLTTESALRRGLPEVSGRRSGFTLVELLTVIAIIGMLGAISITTVRASIQSAKETQTRTTIAKIDNVLIACYEKYQYRLIDFMGKIPPEQVNNLYNNSPELRARYRLEIIRDLLRCDFPCTPSELSEPSQYNNELGGSYTPLQEAIINTVNSCGGLSTYDIKEEYKNKDPDEKGFGEQDPVYSYRHVANAELLYLVVMNADPEARALFAEREIGDVDGNGLYEFIDGWGNPICWMRWAPGLESSDRQPLGIEMRKRLDPRFDEEYVGYIDPSDSDPFNPMNIEEDSIDTWGSRLGWSLVPYVFSAGADEKYGLRMPNPQNRVEMNNPFFSGSDPMVEELPVLDDSREFTLHVGKPYDRYNRTHKDNIDNHTLVR